MITIEKAIQTVERLLADPKFGPDHVATCHYGTLDEPICIVGHIVAEHEPEAFERWQLKDNQDIAALIEGEVVHVDSVHLSGALIDAQVAQDHKAFWKDAGQYILDLKDVA